MFLKHRLLICVLSFKIQIEAMKKIYILLITLLSFQVFSQKDYNRYYNSWRLGLNIGAAWQTADYRSCYGMGGGFTLEKGFHENSTNIFSFAIRGRYLGANTYGMDFNRNYDIKTNDAYNGKYNPKVNYGDTVHKGRNYVYDNYKMTLGEGSLELQLTFNRLRERSHVLLNLWGGLGITSFRTKSDLLDANGKMYDFSLVDSTGNQTRALSSYNSMIDNKYESDAYGSKAGNLITFSPSAGIGLGYQFGPGFSMLFEYKVTFPQGTNADLLDGRLGSNKDMIAGSNDYYHYAGLNLLFTLRGKKKNPTTVNTNQTVYTNTVVGTNTVTPTNSLVTTNTVVSNIPPTEPKPIITYITPSINGHVVNNIQYKISAQILNITSASQIQFKLNGLGYSGFTFNAQTHILEFNANLNVGTNSIQIVATNSAGSDNKSTSVIYELPKPAGTPPIVNLLNPGSAINATNNPLYNFKLSVLNISVKSDIDLLFNGVAQSNFTYNNMTKEVFFQTNLVVGNNTVVVKGTNQYGVDSKTVNVNYTPQVQAKLPPVVTIFKPLVSPASVSNPNYIFKATVTNVLNTSGLVVKYNGIVITNYTYDGFNLNYPSILSQGNNTFEVIATNNDGTDSKTATVNFRQKAVGIPPVVSLVNPANQMNATDNLLYNFKLSVLNVNSQADIELLFNGVAQSNFTYDINTKEVFFQTNLVVGNNIVLVKGTNTFGVDSKTVYVNYTPHDDIKLPPIITFINPVNLSGSSQSTNYVYKATIANMLNSNNVVAKFNGTIVTDFTFDGFNLSYPATLNIGSNSLEITATNNYGTDTKTAIINYKPKIVSRPPLVSILNPIGTPTVNVTSYNFQFKALYVTQNQISVSLNGSTVTSYNFVSSTGSFVGNLNQGINILSVSATNADGTDSKTENIVYILNTDTASVSTPTTPSTPTTVTTPTVTENQNKRITICHIPPGNPGNPQTITIPLSAWPAHQAHGDVIGTCSVTSTPTTVVTPTAVTTPTINTNSADTTNGKITICHLPPGNNQNPQTISIPLSAWPAHQAHGDVMGACPSEKTAPVKINPRMNPLTPNNQNKKTDSTNTQPINTPRRPR